MKLALLQSKKPQNKADAPDCIRLAMPHASGMKRGMQQVIRRRSVHERKEDVAMIALATRI